MRRWTICEQAEEHHHGDRYGRENTGGDEQSLTISARGVILLGSITEEEFKAIRKVVCKKYKPIIGWLEVED